MKISHIKLNCKQSSPSVGETSLDHVLVFFRSPVVLNIGGKQHMLKDGCAIIYSSGSSRSFDPLGDSPLRFDTVSFRTSSAERSYLSSMNVPFDKPILLEDDYVISMVLKSIKSQSIRRSRYFSEFAELAMRLIFIALGEACGEERTSPDEILPHYAQLKALRDSIYDDPINRWSVDEMSADLGISRAYFHRLYLEAFGVTCRQDVIESRLLYAAELLKSTDLSVSAVAEQCGYDSDSYFMRQFKKHKGCTPTEYRRRPSEYDE